MKDKLTKTLFGFAFIIAIISILATPTTALIDDTEKTEDFLDEEGNPLVNTTENIDEISGTGTIATFFKNVSNNSDIVNLTILNVVIKENGSIDESKMGELKSELVKLLTEDDREIVSDLNRVTVTIPISYNGSSSTLQKNLNVTFNTSSIDLKAIKEQDTRNDLEKVLQDINEERYTISNNVSTPGAVLGDVLANLEAADVDSIEEFNNISIEEFNNIFDSAVAFRTATKDAVDNANSEKIEDIDYDVILKNLYETLEEGDLEVLANEVEGQNVNIQDTVQRLRIAYENIEKVKEEVTQSIQQQEISSYRQILQEVRKYIVYVDGTLVPTINEGIESVKEGGVVLVAEGEYEEKIDLDTIGITLRSLGEAKIKNNKIVGGGDTQVTLSADNTSIEGFTIDVFPADGQTPGGISLQGDNTQAVNNTVSDEKDGNRMIAGTGDNITVLNNKIIDGALGYSGEGSATFINNTIEGTIIDGEAFWAGSQEMYESLTIRGNNFQNVDYQSPVRETFKLTVGESLGDSTVNGLSDKSQIVEDLAQSNEGVRTVFFQDEEKLFAPGGILTVREAESIQETIDRVKDFENVDTVVVEEGTYEEDLVLNVTGLTLQGPNAGNSVENVFKPQGEGDVDIRPDAAVLTEKIDVSANNTVLDGFEIYGSYISLDDDVYFNLKNSRGVSEDRTVYANDGFLTAQNNLFRGQAAGIGALSRGNITENIFRDNEEGIGIGDGTLGNIFITNNTFENNDRHIKDYFKELNITDFVDTNTFETLVIGNNTLYNIIQEAESLSIDENITTTTENLSTSIRTNVGNADIEILSGTNITYENGSKMSFADVIATAENASNISIEGEDSITVVRWGVNNETLNFTPDITVRLHVDESLNGEELEVRRSTDGDSWTTQSLSTSTCTVSDSTCTFQTSQASWFAAFQEPETETTTTTSGGGGGGGTFIPASTGTTEEDGDDEDVEEAEAPADADEEPAEEETVEPGEPVVIDGEAPEQETDTEEAPEEEAGEAEAPTGLGGFIAANTPQFTTALLGFLVLAGIGGYAYMKRREN